MNEDLKIIKKMYGEKMMYLCRELFPTLLEKEGLLSKLILDNFAPSRLLYSDIVINEESVLSFKNYIYSLLDVEKLQVKENKSPKELLEEVGYTLYECKTEEDIQKFKKYYAKGEVLCTFNGGRLDRCHVFFAVKKKVDEIKRGNYENPKRQDEYGTSVISIQFTKGEKNTVSIKNRYNHTVNNPDATFSNNLENIVSGLTRSFEKTYGLNIHQNCNFNFELHNYVMAEDGKYYKYNYEIDNVYYCPNNIIIDNFEVKEYPKERYIIMEDFILDIVNKEIKLYKNCRKDSFMDGLQNIQKINITKSKDSANRQIEIITKFNTQIIIELDKTNQITGYKNNEIIEIGDDFLFYNRKLKYIELNNVKKIGSFFLHENKELTKLNLPNLEEIGESFIYENRCLENVNLPNLKYADCGMLFRNIKLISLNLPKLESVGSEFLFDNPFLKELYVPNLIKAGNNFLCRNLNLKIINIDSLAVVGDSFLKLNLALEELNAPSLQLIGKNFLLKNKRLKKIYVPVLEKDILNELLYRFYLSIENIDVDYEKVKRL